ncbi:MAG TPA: UvrD-helicase domain-containing protein [Candidatus Dormibacteraeota bacterium]|nr:UvrD-helicase domain-containing protein [Candidatus Dormibacteraeota bacterium]
MVAPQPEVDALLARLNPPQQEAVTHGDGPLLIFAGAGSGKTRVLTARIAYLIATRRVWPDRLLAVTFTNKAAREMRARVEALVGAGREQGPLLDPVTTQRMWVGTFHATAVRILRREAQRLGMPSSFVIFDEDDTRAALRRVLEELRLDPKRYPIGALSNSISQAKNELKRPEDYPNRSYADEIIRRVYESYQELLRRSGGLDFDDLIMKLVELLSTDAEALEKWRDRFRHVLVDEYQDTNRAQYVLVNLLGQEHRNVAVVGDDDQSIYRFRGADVRNILDFRKDYPDAHVVHLEQNYRSSQAILDTAYSVIRANPERAEKRLWTERAGGEKVMATQAYNEIEEAEFVADEIERLRKTEQRGYSDFAILYRTNAQSRSFEDVLARRRIPYRLVGGIRFWERREVKDVVAYLRFCFNPRDALSFARIVSVPSRKIGSVTVEAVNSFARGAESDILTLLAEPARIPGVPRAAVAALQGFRAQIESVRATMGVLRPSELLDHVIEVMELRRHYLDGTPQGEARMENLNELRGLAESFDDREPEQGLEDFLAEVALVSDVDAYDENGEGVTLITLHMVKGLEFAVVFMVGMEEGLLPHQRALDEREENPSAVGATTEMAEERRLCYVGMTRAKDRLYLSCAFRRHLYGRSQPAFPSRFLTEIPQSLLAAPRGSAPVAPPRQGYRERYQERQVQAAPGPPPVQRFVSGDRVTHPSFGVGTVVKSTLTRTDEELVVKFDKAGLKILSGMLAPLTK